MTDPRERVLEYALEKVLGARDEVDLSERILTAWGRGIPGSVDVDRLEPLHAGEPGKNGRNGSEGPRLSRIPARARPRLPAVLAAAAALLALAALGWWSFSGVEEAPPAFAVASGGLEHFSGPDREATRGPIAPGDVVLAGPGPAELALPSGAVLDLEPGCVVVAGERDGLASFLLAAGSLEVRAGTEALWIETKLASLRARPGAELTAAIEVSSPGPATLSEGGRARVLALLDPGFAGGRELTVDVRAGTAELAQDEALLTILPSAGPGTVAGPLRLAEADVERYDALFRELFTALPRPEAKGYPERLLEMDELSAVLARSRPLWGRLERDVGRLVESPDAPPGFLPYVIDFLASDPSEEALELARRLWMEDPTAFLEEHLVAFAERGAFEFQREIEALVATYDPDEPPVPPEPERAPPVLAAAYLAFQGDDAGRAILEDAVERGALEPARPAWSPSLEILAGLALEELGVPGAWERATELLRGRVERSLAGFDTITAGGLVLQLEYFHLARAAHETPRLGTLMRDVSRHVAARRPDVQTEAAIRDLLARLTG